jgi:8-oxo-dGTP pyrophosphatase MutT (NUDIX family)
MPAEIVAAGDGEPMRSRSHGQDWIVSWQPPTTTPAGTSNGAAGVCLTDAGELVLISHDGTHWGFPAGRPDGDETPLDTLRREMLEEACATVVDARLLGFARSRCVGGRQRGLVLVRSYWRALVEIGPWEPAFEIRHRRVIPVTEAWRHVQDPDLAETRISHRALLEAGLSSGHL